MRFCATNIRNSFRVLFKIALVLVRLDDIASFIANADHSMDCELLRCIA